MSATNHTDEPHDQVYLPDFCAARTIFVIVLVAELVAFVLTLAAWDANNPFLIQLSKTSFLVLWIALLGTALMCQLKARIEKMARTRAFVTAFAALIGMSIIVAEGAWRLTNADGQSLVIEGSHGAFLLRTVATATIVIALAMRYLYVSSEWRRSIVLEAQSRISALQALIRPHFLFNSMNTIASLTRSDPAQAEEAVEDLSDLLRANLNSSDQTSLKQELEVAAIYQRIEKLRLGDRLRVRWDIDDLPMRARIPSLTIQPLLENAIYHGIEMLDGGGEVTVSGSKMSGYLTITMSNPVAAGGSRKKDGNHMAVENIRQRFELAYNGDASVKFDESESAFTVELRFPYQDQQ